MEEKEAEGRAAAAGTGKEAAEVGVGARVAGWEGWEVARVALEDWGAVAMG
jgi:hypothetical protein